MVLIYTAVFYYEVRHPIAFVLSLIFQTWTDLSAFHMQPFYYY
jgi:hypothetical protein